MSARLFRVSSLTSFLVVLIATVLLPQKAFGSNGNKPVKQSNISVTTYFSDFDSNSLPTTIASDGQGAYVDGVAGVTSFLTANTCNSLPTGDWRFDSTNSPTRAVSEGFFSQDEVQPGDPHYQAPANPPYLGSLLQKAHLNVQCTCTGKDMGAMAPGSTITCPMINSWTDSVGNAWGFSPAKSFYGAPPETTDVQITCNSLGSDGRCSDWFIDPDPLEGAEAVARLVETPNTHPTHSIDDGDFYLRFHIHITRP
jgi:hypothetical protein